MINKYFLIFIFFLIIFKYNLLFIIFLLISYYIYNKYYFKDTSKKCNIKNYQELYNNKFNYNINNKVNNNKDNNYINYKDNYIDTNINITSILNTSNKNLINKVSFFNKNLNSFFY
jgi:hypothetical protein